MSWRGSYGSRGKGKRRFAAQGSWRSSESLQGEGEAVLWLHRPPDAPLPSAAPTSGLTTISSKQSGRGKDEVHLTQLAREFWGTKGQSSFKASVVDGVYSVIVKTRYALRLITSLEYSQYLENYLWPHFSKERGSTAYLMSIVLMVNEKWRERVPLWSAFQQKPDTFPDFFHCLLEAALSNVEGGKLSMRERSILIIFLVHAFNSLEVDLVREQVQRLVSLPIWQHLVPSRLQDELNAVTKLRKYWNIIQKRDKQGDPATMEKLKLERGFLWHLMEQFFAVLSSIPAEGAVSEDAVTYCERFLELVTDLEAQLPTRRFFNTLLDSCNFMVRCSISVLSNRKPEGHLFSQLLTRLKLYTRFEINDQSGSALTDHEMTDIHYNRITSLQRAAFKLFPALRSFSLSNVASVDTRAALTQHFSKLNHSTMHEIAAYLHLVTPDDPGDTLTSDLLLEVLVSHHERRLSQLETINALPLYPTEEILWDENIVPSEFYNGETCLALPKLNLQFLTLHDYLLRNYVLFRLESTYEIREDIEDVVSRLKPWANTDGNTEFGGWARMALPISTFSVVEVGRPNVGENRPSRVRADVTIELNVADSVKMEWEGLRKHDVCFVVTVKAQMSPYDQFDWNRPFVPQVGLAYVRGCEIEGMLDEEGRVIEEGPEPKPRLPGKSRTFRVWLDTNQYQLDMSDVVQGKEDVYETFNIFMRRKPKENNFKAVLETIRDLMNTECVVPEWLHDTFLGYGDADAAHYSQMPNQITALDFKDTFLSLDHLRDSFPKYSIKCSTDDPHCQVPPFKLVFPTPTKAGQKRKVPPENQEGEESASETTPTIQVEPYVLPNRGPYPYNQPKKNAVPFTATQVEAILSGMQHGLTLVVGPPGTGKTDVAVQIISNLYHNFPDQRTLLVTHSNQALNQLFEKIMCLDIEERHLLRLGHGEEELATDKDFSRYGRVNFILALRMELLKEVERLQESLGVGGDVSYTCETAGHFFLYQIMARWENYSSKVKALANKPEGLIAISELFPFAKYFSNAPQPLFKGQSLAEDWDIAEGCYRHIKKIFKQLEEFRAFELLRSSRDRINYLLTREAKIIAMTCTHAALKRKDLVQLSFKYDNVLMEEAAQILEVETFIPLMLQQPQDGHSRLKRVIMIGDHHQLPPVIKNMSFQKYSNMEQSMFTRFVRLGVPTIQLDGQGRARPSICQLYKWRYKDLGDLPHVREWPEYRVTNPGMRFDYQLIDVGDFNGVGESEPTPHFYQNLGEAEFAVGVFMYLRLQGYPPDKIAILTTYNGQKHLIRDVLAKRCANNPVFGLPEKVTTVDRYQGQQNDYIILSLVRTRHVGHLRDVRRLVVAMSRARLGLYILARVALFSSCTELQPTWKILLQRPTQLHLVPNEFYPAVRGAGEDVSPESVLVISNMPHLAQYVYQDYHIRIDALRAKMGGANTGLAPPPEQVGNDDGALSEGMESEQQSTAAKEETNMEGEVTEASNGGREEESEKEEATVTAADEDTARETEDCGKSERDGATDIRESTDSEKEGKETTVVQEENKETSAKECTPPPAPVVGEATPGPPAPVVGEATLGPSDSDEQATQQITDENEEQKMETD